MTRLTTDEKDAARKIRGAVDHLNSLIRDASRHGVSVQFTCRSVQSIGWAETYIVEATISKEL